MKKIIVTILILTLFASLFVGCGKKDDDSLLSQDKAQEIALEELGMTKKDVDDVHIHVATYEDAPCYSVHITAGDKEYEVIVHVSTGEVLHVGNDAH